MKNKIESFRYNSIEEIFNDVHSLRDWKYDEQPYLEVAVRAGIIFNGTGDGPNKIDCPPLLKHIILSILKTKFPSIDRLANRFQYLEDNNELNTESLCYLDALYSIYNDQHRKELRENHEFGDYIKTHCGIDITTTFATKEQLESLSKSCQKHLEVKAPQLESQSQPQ